MSERLKEVDEGDDEYILRPYGLLVLKLESHDAAQKVCDALELHMRRHKRSVVADDDGLHFDQGMYAEDWAVLNRTAIWHQFPEGDYKARALADLKDACDAAQKRTWERRRAERSHDHTSTP